jgi:uncharacterized protein YndB with AHSA1/START domain
MSDRIEKRLHLRAPRSRVWKALADSQQFGEWFRMTVDGPFVAGQTSHGRIIDPPGYEHLDFSLHIDRIEPETLFSFRWHPYAIDPKVDYSHEPMTLCTFELSDHEGGTLLRLTESGFEGIPAARRALAFRMNDGGWTEQSERIKKYVET